MKKLLSLLFVVAAIFSLAASAPTVTDTLKRIQCDTSAATAQAFFEKATVVDGQSYAQPWDPVTWSVASTRTVTYTFNGQTYTQTYAQVMAAVVAIANQERTDPSP